MSLSTKDAFTTVFCAYKLPQGAIREEAINHALSAPDLRNIIKNWLETHTDDTKNSPIAQDLKSRISALDTVNTPRGFWSFTTGAVNYVTQALKAMKESVIGSTEADIEHFILSGGIKQLTEYFDDYPEALDTHSNLLKMHLQLGTLSFVQATPLLEKMPMHSLVSIVSARDSDGKTALHDLETLKVTLPLLLEQLSTKDLKKVLSVETNDHQKPLMQISADTLSSLSNLQFLRLASILTNDDEAALELIMHERPMTHAYYKLLQQADSYDTKTAIEVISNQFEFTEEEKYAAIAHYIEFHNMALKDVESSMRKEDFLRLAPHLRLANFEDFEDIPLAQELLKNCPHLNSLKIRDGRIVEGIRMLAQCQTFDCRTCKGLRYLPEIPQCQTLDCCDCNDLVALPEIPQCEMLDCSLCFLLEALCHLPKCKDLDCSHCHHLLSLPEIPQCQTLVCGGCINLRTLPNRHQLQTLDCFGCRALTALPKLPLCQTLDCRSCILLTGLPELPQCRQLKCSRCDRLAALPDLPSCLYLNYSFCPLILLVPQLPFGATVIAESAIPFSALRVDVEKFTTDPKALLNELGNHLLHGRPFPSLIYFKNNQPSEGIDAGGLRRDLVTRLCENLFKMDLSETDRGKFLSMSETFLPVAYEEAERESRFYWALGVLFALCYHGMANIKTGPLFNPEVYEMLTAFGTPGSDEWVAYNYFRSDFNNRTIMEALLSGIGDIPNLDQQDLEKLAYMENDERDEFATFTQEYLIENRERLRQKILDVAKVRLQEDKEKYQVLLAVSWTALGMKAAFSEATWAQLRAQGAEALQERIEGVLTAELLKNKLVWTSRESIDDDHLIATQSYVTSWIDRANKDQLGLFVRYITGCKTLSAADVKIEVCDLESSFLPSAHTCYYSLDVSGNYEGQDQFDERLQKALTYGMAGTGFSSA